MNNIDRRKALYRAMSKSCDGHSASEVMNASGNVMMSMLYTVYPTRKEAQHAWDEIARRVRQQLGDRYDAATGKRPAIVRPPFAVKH